MASILKKVTGNWHGTYSYDSIELYPNSGPVSFNLTLKQGWFGNFRGDVCDVGPGGMPGVGHVEGHFSYPRIRFVKWMPVAHVTTEAGQTVSLREQLNQIGFPCERDSPHEPIYYLGEFSSPEAAAGTWLIRAGRFDVGFDFSLPFPESTGKWSLARSAV